jgi:hypothetical protein
MRCVQSTEHNLLVLNLAYPQRVYTTRVPDKGLVVHTLDRRPLSHCILNHFCCPTSKT